MAPSRAGGRRAGAALRPPLAFRYDPLVPNETGRASGSGAAGAKGGHRFMRVGISLTSARRVSDPRAGARFMVERAAAARRAELDSLFVGDHHATAAPYYQNVPILGRLLAEWGDRPAGCLFLLPLWNPVLVAEHVGTLAAIAQGRFILQCGLGDDAVQFAAMGRDIKTRPSAFEEALSIVRRLLRGEVVSSNGRFQVHAARVALVPAEPVEYWIGATADVAVERAARLGDGWLASPGLRVEEARRLADLYLERARAHGRPPTAVAIRRDIYVGESDAEAESVALPIIRAGYRGFDPSALVFGSVATVIAAFRTLAEMGYTDVIVRHVTDDHPKVLGSLARLREVRAALQRT
jgi:alkanesulfonate monooxygenase SsuD/methylene tetrahydromethanopterin reductase-like flavin-dependent oxidoreductase (luciferase family)